MKRSILSLIALLVGIGLVSSCSTGGDTTGRQDINSPAPTPSQSAKAPTSGSKKPTGGSKKPTSGTQNTTGRQDKQSTPTPTPSEQ